MSETSLRQALTELRAELTRLEQDEAKVRQRLDTLLKSLESHAQAPGEKTHHSLLDELNESILEFETSHPRMTAILGRITAALGNISPQSGTLS